ncbi:MAG: radical SAM protein [Oscillospiraceae bacterium]|jgi:nitrogenase molybdenum-iron protein alpha/beta subunit/MoaA/NifB/PqqE/SkfB family radical SAM enzyme|nr:radical SAM protein [Oscillospiraceae bacterium]
MKKEISPIVSLNVNPCKMCMPMGSVNALCGVAGCMTVLHGSQGCATYIRRHMATHYNEPIDIASSSLTEEGTVFGGEKNLIKGIENLIKLYDPDVVGVSTTCLAETIGEDVPAMLARFRESHPDMRAKLINVTSAGYSGTQFEGFFRALRALAEQVEPNNCPNGKVNIITGQISPADTRWLKDLLSEMGIDAILLPDVSENLDGTHEAEYNRLKSGGVTLAEIAQMAGARHTIEISTFAAEEYSPARYLLDAFGVPFTRLNLPVSLRDIDALINALKSLGGTVTERLRRERGRYLDAMFDSHKYNAKVRAAVFGEPDFVYAVTGLLAENGAMPSVCATGSVCPGFADKVRAEVEPLSEFHLDAGNVIIADDEDFEHIEQYAAEYGVNLLIGSGDGRRVAERLKLPLVRCAFPIHDHIGGQRVRTLGYDGALTLLDRVTNAILSGVEETFRENLYEKYYKGNSDTKVTGNKPVEKHPCFSGCAKSSARIHLPVAPKCNIQCNYCVRKFDCPNESRPGVTSEILTPRDALAKFLDVRAQIPNLGVVGIAGPGDALADFDLTRETIRLIRQIDKDVLFCLSTNGLLLPFYAEELISLGVTHVTVTVNAVNPSIGAKIYSRAEYLGVKYNGETGAAILLANQIAGITRLVAAGIKVKVNTVMIKGINDRHIPEVMGAMKGLGCEIGNIMPLIPVVGSAFEALDMTNAHEIAAARKECEPILTQMYHCRQCRADAIGTLDNDISFKFRNAPQPAASGATTLFAVSSESGVLVDQHFGHTKAFCIYEYKNGSIRFKENRKVPQYCTGEDDDAVQSGKMAAILKTVEDCACVLSMRMGDSPRNALRAKGIQVYTTYNRIEDAVNEALTALQSRR